MLPSKNKKKAYLAACLQLCAVTGDGRRRQQAGRAGGGRELERKTAFGVCGDVQKGNGQAVGLLEGGTAGSKGNERLK